MSNNFWGYELILDLKDCNPSKINNESVIKTFVIELCDNIILMTRYGEIWLKRFGKDESVTGFTLFQAIEESNISGHFIEQCNSICLNIFSCKKYDVIKTRKFCEDFFNAKKSTVHYLGRLEK